MYQQARVQEVPLQMTEHQPTKFKRHSYFSSAGWLLETITLSTSVVLFGGTVAILCYMDGHALSDWTSAISLNAVISVLTTACGAALMHGVSESVSQHKWLYFKTGTRRLNTFKKIDQVSRGPSGALRLIFGLKWNLATLGAIITVARLALSPLVQQVILIDQRSVAIADSEVTYGFAHSYNRNGLDSRGFVGSVPQDPQMQAVILQGICNISVPAVFSCPGTCSWDERTVSLGFKVDCEDVTQDALDAEQCQDVGDGETVCELSTPNGSMLVTVGKTMAYGTSYALNATSPEGVEILEIDFVPSAFPKFINLAVYRATLDNLYDASDKSITQCSMSVTAYEYPRARDSGNDFHFEAAKEVDFDGGMSFNSRDEDPLRRIYYTDASESKDLPELGISEWDVYALQTFFISSSISSRWLDGAFDNRELGLSAVLREEPDIAGRFNAMAESMTNYVRSGPNPQFSEGLREDSVPFVSVRWYWLAGPAAIELLAVLFVLMTMISNRSSRGAPLWKSSVIAVLNTNSEEGSGILRPQDGDLKGLEKRTAKTFVRLE